MTVLVDDARFHLAEPRHILLHLEKGALKPVPLVPDPLEAGGDAE
jgi:hypothetical protein